MDLDTLEPRQVWKHFFDISAIPHPSRREGALARHLVGWARQRGLDSSIDESNNVIIWKPASPGREGEAGIILQAHLDMVCQAAGGSSHNFERDPIRPLMDAENPGWIRADGTTLGADDAIGIAVALAILEDTELKHGPLECLLTTNEEDGMSGAIAIKPGALKGRVLLNLDSVDDAKLIIGCAGSIRTASELSRPAEASLSGLTWLELSVGGLLGGHSGLDIDKGRANAPLALVRLLLRSGGKTRIASLSGGTAANAIPRDARATVGLPSGELDAFRSAFRRESEALRAELRAAEPGFVAALAPLAGPAPAAALGAAESSELLSLLYGQPNGLVAMEADMPGVVRTSLNLGRLEGHAESGNFILSILTMIRSSSEEEEERLASDVERRLGLAAEQGWRVSTNRPAVSPAWTPNLASPILASAKAIYRELFGKEPCVTATHGGLETGHFRPVFPHWDMISLGSNILYAHSPDERVEIASVARLYRFVAKLVERSI